MPFCFGDEGWGTLGVLEDWGLTAYWLVSKIYTGPSGQSAGLFGLWPSFPSSIFYINRTATGIEFCGNANTEFEHWEPSDCRLRDLYSYGIGNLTLPENTWITLILSVVKCPTEAYIQIGNSSSGLGNKLLVRVRAEWHVDRVPFSSTTLQGEPDENNSESYIREWRASPPPTCYFTEFKWYKFYNVKRPTGVTGLSIGVTTAGTGGYFEGAIMETSLWVGSYMYNFTSEDRAGFRQTPGYALNPTAENDWRPSLHVYWPLISDGDTDYQAGAQTGDLTAYTSGTSTIGDCYNWEDILEGAYEPEPAPPRERKSGRIITPAREAGLYTLKRNAYTRTPERSAEVNI